MKWSEQDCKRFDSYLLQVREQFRALGILVRSMDESGPFRRLFTMGSRWRPSQYWELLKARYPEEAGKLEAMSWMARDDFHLSRHSEAIFKQTLSALLSPGSLDAAPHRSPRIDARVTRPSAVDSSQTSTTTAPVSSTHLPVASASTPRVNSSSGSSGSWVVHSASYILHQSKSACWWFVD